MVSLATVSLNVPHCLKSRIITALFHQWKWVVTWGVESWDANTNISLSLLLYTVMDKLFEIWRTFSCTSFEHLQHSWHIMQVFIIGVWKYNRNSCYSHEQFIPKSKDILVRLLNVLDLGNLSMSPADDRTFLNMFKTGKSDRKKVAEVNLQPFWSQYIANRDPMHMQQFAFVSDF